uniref:Uncharacterized protein n=1 Tax=Brassica oleracea var. oleracea TaxID=109376 RepID=A0A0D3BLJ0_BRAOL
MVLTAVDSASAATLKKLDSLSTVKEDPVLFEQEESFGFLKLYFNLVMDLINALEFQQGI